MSEVDISPLAKRLAEENNVDWRKLRGSGAEGKVVERDVLEFLARVMSGQEDVDPTPEPLPEGMEEWPEEDIAAYRRGARERAAEAAEGATAETPEPDEIDEGIFLFDDEDPEPVKPESEDEPDVFAVAGGDEIEEDEDLFLDLGGDEDEDVDASDGGAFDVSVDLDAVSEPQPQRGAVDLGDVGLDLDEPEVAEPAGSAGTRRDARDLDFSGTDVLEDESPPVAADQDTFVGDASVSDAAVAEDGAEDEVFEAEPEPSVAGPAAPEAGASGAGQAALPLVRHGTLLRRHVDVTALKSAQAALARELGHEEPVPIAAFLLRAAAKAHRQHPLGEGGIALATIEGGLAFASLGDPAQPTFRDLVSALMSAPATDAAPQDAALAVVDLSELDVDEAVLDASLPVLAFGRLLYDDQGGEVQGTLSLSGDVRPDVGGRLLAAAAELLAAPVRLVV